MAITTEDPHAWFVAVDDSGEKQTVYNNETTDHNYPFAFEVNFSDEATPPVNTVTLYNMSKEHRNFYEKGQKCYLYFNWGPSKKIISEGFISKIGVNQSDGTTDTLVLTFTEGTDYSNVSARKIKNSKTTTKKVQHYKTIKKKVPGHYVRKRTIKNHHYVYKKVWVKGKVTKKRVKTRAVNKKITKTTNITFKKGKSYSTIISTIASRAGIKIAKMSLAKNKVMKKAYTAKGKPLALIKQLVKECDSKMTYVRGQLQIVNPKSTKRTWYEIDDQDLIQPPTYNEDDDGDGTWEINIPLIPDITVNVGIKMESRYLKGKYYVVAGQHTSDGENPETQCSLKAL